jgi:hypothetical protein
MIAEEIAEGQPHSVRKDDQDSGQKFFHGLGLDGGRQKNCLAGDRAPRTSS